MKVFLSYDRADRALAQALAERLEAEGHEPWFADREIFPGQNWAKAIGKALDESRAMVVLISPESMSSRAVRSDVEFALGSKNYEHRLIPLIARPTEDVPWILRNLAPIDVGNSQDRALRKVIDLVHQSEHEMLNPGRGRGI